MPEKGKPCIFGERALEVWTLGRNFYRGGSRWVEETEGKGKGARPLLSPATFTLEQTWKLGGRSRA